MYKILSLCCFLLLAACMASGAQKTLNTMADALEKKDASLFLAQIEGKSYASNAVRTRTAQDKALSTLDAMGRSLGLGGVDDLVGSMLDIEADVRQDFMNGVSTGELAAECSQAKLSGCPWVAASLRAATVKNINETAAVAKVTTPANISTWLALQKRGEQWLVVGQAPREDMASEYATGGKPAPQAPTSPAKSEKPAEDTVKML